MIHGRLNMLIRWWGYLLGRCFRDDDERGVKDALIGAEPVSGRAIVASGPNEAFCQNCETKSVERQSAAKLCV